MPIIPEPLSEFQHFERSGAFPQNIGSTTWITPVFHAPFVRGYRTYVLRAEIKHDASQAAVGHVSGLASAQSSFSAGSFCSADGQCSGSFALQDLALALQQKSFGFDIQTSIFGKKHCSRRCP